MPVTTSEASVTSPAYESRRDTVSPHFKRLRVSPDVSKLFEEFRFVPPKNKPAS